MQSVLDIFAPLHIHSWYVLAAFVLALVVQIAKQTPVAKTVWYWLPQPWRWVWTALAGFATGFVTGYQLGLPAVGALLSGIGGAFGVGTLASGLNIWLETSKIPWPGSPTMAPIVNHLDRPAAPLEPAEKPWPKGEKPKG